MTKKKSIQTAVAAGIVLGLAPFSPSNAETFTLQDATIDQIQKAMADGALSSVELTSMYLNRIAVYDQSGINLNAVPVVNAATLAEAAAADTLRGAGPILGPLHGVPAIFKDNFHIRGMATQAGLNGWSNLIAEEDATIVKAWRDGGGIVLGRTNLDTLTLSGSGFSEAFGQTTSPYTQELDPLGSSTGSAVGVSANFASVGFGSDGYGSLRTPSIRSQICTSRSTVGLVPGTGAAPEGPYEVDGPMTRTIRDLALVMNAVVVEDPDNVFNSFMPTFSERRPADYVAALTPNLAGKVFGIPNYALGKPSNSSYSFNLSPGAKAHFDQARAVLVSLGATIREVDVPVDEFIDFEEYSFTGPISFFYQIDDEYWYRFNAGNLGRFLAMTNQKDTPLLAIQRAIDQATDRSGSAKFTLELILDHLVEGTDVGPDNATFASFINQRNSITEGELFGQWMAANGIDALIMPSNFDVEYLAGINYHTTLGLPGVVVPAGASEYGTSDNPEVYLKPFGMTFVGRRFEESKLMSFAFAYEQASKTRQVPALTPSLPGETIEYSTALPPPSRPELSAPALRVAGGAKVTGKGKKAALVINGGARDASGLGSLKVYVNGKKIAAKRAANWKASVKLSALRKFVRGDAKTVSVQVVAKDIYGNTSVTTKNVKLPKGA